MNGPVDVLAVLNRRRVLGILGPKEEAAAVCAAVHGLIDKARGLADAVEFRIDDPRAALLDELRAAITAAGGAA